MGTMHAELVSYSSAPTGQAHSRQGEQKGAKRRTDEKKNHFAPRPDLASGALEAKVFKSVRKTYFTGVTRKKTVPLVLSLTH